MCNPFTTNFTKKQTARWFVALGVMILFIGVFIVGFLNYYVMPVLNGWELVVEHVLNGENSFFNQLVQTEVDSFAERSKDTMQNTDWKSMTDIETREKLQLMIDNGTEDIFVKLWGVLLVVVLPVLTIPLVLWLGIKITIWLAEKFIKLFRLYSDDDPTFELYLKGRTIMGKPKQKN